MSPSASPPPDRDPKAPRQTPLKQAVVAGVNFSQPPAEVARFISTIKNADQQVGEHIVAALQHEGTVAVLTSVIIGPDGRQHLVSAALDAARAAQVHSLLQAAVEEMEDDQPCVGFHCLIQPKTKSTDSPG